MLLPPPVPRWRDVLAAQTRRDENSVVADLLRDCSLSASLSATARTDIGHHAAEMVMAVRDKHRDTAGIAAFLQEFPLHSQGGAALLSLAESLLRVPDDATADLLIRDKLTGTRWEHHLGHSPSLLVNASTIGLAAGSRLLASLNASGRSGHGASCPLSESASYSPAAIAAHLGEPLVRHTTRRMVQFFSRQFVRGTTIEDALHQSRHDLQQGWRYSWDMLGESAGSDRDAERYMSSCLHGIHTIGAAVAGHRISCAAAGVSVKLSGLHPRYHSSRRAEMLDVLAGRLLTLAVAAREQNISLCVDAEESERLELGLEIFEKVYRSPRLDGWEGLGLAVQAYQKRATTVISLLADMAAETGRQIPVRLVKGAYWDSEIKRAQSAGLDDYPVFTRKDATDLSYIACASLLFRHGSLFFPQFATHNALTIATVLHLSAGKPFEFQRLHGMGEPLYRHLAGSQPRPVPCRIYAPVGPTSELLPYLVRRLLENGANSSFVHRLPDDSTTVEALVADPVARLLSLADRRNPALPPPPLLYGESRRNARGLDLNDSSTLEKLVATVARSRLPLPLARPLVKSLADEGSDHNASADKHHDDHDRLPLYNPADRRQAVGHVINASWRSVRQAVASANAAFPAWSARSPEERSQLLLNAATTLEQQAEQFIALCVREAGKTLADAVAEVREAVDFLRYYALQLPSLAESGLGGRGVFACISPWNFPLAIFTGQVSAALAAGNTVVAKPAEQTPLAACAMVQLLHDTGIPPEVLHLVTGDGEGIGKALVSDPRIAGVAFTGSLAVARQIQHILAQRGEAVPLIAETGGLNAMIVDSTALPEQVVRDVMISAFGSAGQRCSALRMLYLQEDIADQVISRLIEAVKTLRPGDPLRPDTDIGPIIDPLALATLQTHARYMNQRARLLYALPMPESCAQGTFFTPHIYEVSGIDAVGHEIFGPILHIARYRATELASIVSSIRASGYGLTMGLHTRIDAHIRAVHHASAIGNTYVNRTMTGAVVGVQPFGGEGLSGTGPKAGGPHTLSRFACARPQPVAGTLLQSSLSGCPSLADIHPHPSRPGNPAPPPEMTNPARQETVVPAPHGRLVLDELAASQRRALRAPPEELARRRAAAVLALSAVLERPSPEALRSASPPADPALDLVALADQIQTQTSAPWKLPGPAGEHNELYHYPRGIVLVVADRNSDWNDLVLRCATALGAGNAVVVVAPPALAAPLQRLPGLYHQEPPESPLALSGSLLRVEAGGQDEAVALARHPALSMLSLATTDLTLCRAVEVAVAEREGAILPVEQDSFSPASLFRHMVERTLTIDQTAGGGNAALLGSDAA